MALPPTDILHITWAGGRVWSWTRDSVHNLTRRVDRAPRDSSKIRQDIVAIRQQLLDTKRI
jgi:hypothetical protein